MVLHDSLLKVFCLIATPCCSLLYMVYTLMMLIWNQQSTRTFTENYIYIYTYIVSRAFGIHFHVASVKNFGNTEMCSANALKVKHKMLQSDYYAQGHRLYKVIVSFEYNSNNNMKIYGRFLYVHGRFSCLVFFLLLSTKESGGSSLLWGTPAAHRQG